MSMKVSYLIVGVSALFMAACSNGADKGVTTGPKASSTEMSSSAGASDGISDFEVRQTFKSVARNYNVTAATGDNDWLKDAGISASVAVQWPDKLGDVDLSAMQDSIVEMVADTTAYGRDIDKAMMAYVSNIDGTEGCTLTRIDSVPDAPKIAAQTTVSFKVLTRRLAVVERAFYSYQGGAHGDYGSRFINFDLSTGKSLGYDGIFKAGTADSVRQAVIEALLARYNVSKVSDLDNCGIFSANLYVTRNVWLDGDDIVFYYNIYEIAPYAAGPIEVRVPAWKVESLLTPAAAAILL